MERAREAVMLRRVASLEDWVVVPDFRRDVRGWLGFSDIDMVYLL